jgi:hypothetical protein
MTVRTPLILDGSNNLIEMTTAQINAVKDRVRYLYGENPSVILSRQNSGGNLGGLSDTRKQAGASTTDVTNFHTAAETPNVSTVTVEYSCVHQGFATVGYPADTNNVAFPVYQTSGNIRAMTRTDVEDTFIRPAFDTMTGAAGQPGTYYIHTSSTLSGYTAISNDAIYIDSRANVGAYTAGAIGEQQDQPTNIQGYYLLKANNISAPSMVQMLFIRNADANIEQYTQAEMDAWLTQSIQAEARSHLSYNFNGNGINLGSGMTDTILNGSGNYQTRYVNTNDYRTQEFPNGSAVVAATHRLKMETTT